MAKWCEKRYMMKSLMYVLQICKKEWLTIGLRDWQTDRRTHLGNAFASKTESKMSTGRFGERGKGCYGNQLAPLKRYVKLSWPIFRCVKNSKFNYGDKGKLAISYRHLVANENTVFQPQKIWILLMTYDTESVNQARSWISESTFGDVTFNHNPWVLFVIKFGSINLDDFG